MSRGRGTAAQGLVLLAVTALVTGTLATSAGPALAVGQSSFESDDGNMAFDGQSGKTKDWASVKTATAFHSAADLASGQKDNSLGQGSKDDDLVVSVGTGSIPNNKSDLTKVYEYQEQGPDGKQYLYMAWERKNTLGTANMSIELNQNPLQPNLLTTGSKTLRRTKGDALITYDFEQGGSRPSIGLSRWVVSGDPKTACQANNTVPCWGPIVKLTALTPPDADGQVNSVGFTDPISGAKLAQYTFGELGINMTDTGLLTGCQGFSVSWVRSRSSASFDSELKDFIAPFAIKVQLPQDASGAHADSDDPSIHDGAVALRVQDSVLGGFDLPGTTDGSAPTTKSSQTGPGAARAANSLQNIQVPPSDGSLVTAKVLSEDSQSTVDAASATATQTTVSEVAGLDILDGTITSDTLTAVSRTTASPNGAAAFSPPSGVQTINIDMDRSSWTPDKVFTVTPGLVIPLSENVFGRNSYVKVLEEEPASSHPPFGTLGTVGTYEASLDATLLHVHITDRDPGLLGRAGDQILDVVVSKSYGLARHTGIVCTAPQEVSGNASTLQANIPLYSSVPFSLGYVRIAPSGGQDKANVASVKLPASTPLVTAGLASAETVGWFDTAQAVAKSFADVANVCIADAPGGACLVAAKAVHSQADALAVDGSRNANGDATAYVDLTVAGQTFNVTPPANTLMDLGLATVILNEQYCDDPAANVADGCVAGSSAGITVNAIHVIIPGVLDVIVGQSHADATFVPAT
jgi:hypothetical protein